MNINSVNKNCCMVTNERMSNRQREFVLIFHVGKGVFCVRGSRAFQIRKII